ncbi:MAG: PLP-dependent aminotransferase family protein [Burkholderiaceae bacterium]
MFKRLPAHRMPGAGVLPVDWLDADLLGQAIRAAARQGASALLDYGHPQGYLPLREQLAARLGTLDIPATADALLTTAGVTQALDIVAQYLLQRGDVVLVDEPSWFLLFGRFATLGVRVIGVPRLPDGPDLAVLEQLLVAHRPRLFVTSSVLQSPTGASISLRCAHRLLKLAAEHQLLIVEDDVYSDLDPGSGGGPAVRLAALDGLQQVIYLGGFSKTLAANLRVGFVAASAERIRDLTDLKMLLALTTAELNERVVYQVLSDGHYRRHLHRLRDRLDQARGDTMRMLERLEMPLFVEPKAGMYLYADTGCDASLLASRMLEQGFLMAPGSLFMPDQRPSAWMRFNVATSGDPAMIECLARTLVQLRDAGRGDRGPDGGHPVAC